MKKRKENPFVDDVENLSKRGRAGRWLWPQVEKILLKTGSVEGTAKVLQTSPNYLYHWLERKKRRSSWERIKKLWSRERRQAQTQKRKFAKFDSDMRYFDPAHVDADYMRAATLLREGEVEKALKILEKELSLDDDV